MVKITSLCVLLWMTACGGGSGSTQSKPLPAVQACYDVAAAIGNAWKRCGGDYQTNYDRAVQDIHCAMAMAISDEAALRSTCIPSFDNIICSDLVHGTYDDSCKDQILR